MKHIKSLGLLLVALLVIAFLPHSHIGIATVLCLAMGAQVLTSNLIIPYDYVIVQAIGQSATATYSLTMSADSSFELLCILGSSDKQGATDINPNTFSCQMTDQATGRQMASARVPQRLLGGSGQYAVTAKYPIRFPASCVLLFDFLDLNASGTNTATLILRGYKLFQQQ